MFVLGENHFQKYFFVNARVWLVRKMEFSRNQFQLTEKNRPWPRKFISIPIFTSNDVWRERERERERGRRERTPSSSPMIACTISHHVDRSCDCADRIAPIASIALIAPVRSHRAARSRLRAISPSTHRSSPHRSLSLCDFDFCVILIFVVVVVVWWWCFGGCGFWLPEFVIVGWIAVWKICKKIAFSK